MKKINYKRTQAAKLRLQEKATEELWRRGEFVELILNPPQMEMYADFSASDFIMYFFLCSRRLGKSYTLFSIAVAECLKNPRTKVLYLSTTTDQVREIVDQTAEVVLESCPFDLMPKVKQKENKYVFPNGSEIRIKGLDKSGGNAIRGVKADLVIFDEACFMNDLSNILDSVVMPMVIATGGKVLFGSTPPDSPGHDSVGIIARCEEAGALTKKTIYDTLGILYNEKQITLFEEQAGGKETTLFRREYMAEIVTETDLAIVPAFTEEQSKLIVQRHPHPSENKKAMPFWPDCYVGMDLGFRDLTVAVFGYWDYPNAMLVIQDELIWADKQATTDNIATDILAKEKELWGDRPPHARYCDNDPRFIEDIKNLHDLRFKRSDKDNKEASVNQLNILVNAGLLRIDPKCTTLVKHLRYGLWKENRREFQRTKDLHHCDAIDALLYMMRNIARSRNPVPEQFFHPGKFVMHDWGNELNKPKDDIGNIFKKLFR